jgi:hypothetical protein
VLVEVLGHLKNQMTLDDIKMDLKTGYGGMDWIDLAEDRIQWKVHVNLVEVQLS